MSENTVTIRAELLTDIPQKAAESAAAVKDLAATVEGSSATAGGSAKQLGEHLDGVASSSVHAENSSKKLGKQLDMLHESGKRVRETFAGVGESIRTHLQYPMMQLSWMLEGATAGMVTWGLTTESSFQTATLALQRFTGSAGVGSGAFSALHGMVGPVGLGGLTSAYEMLSQAGMPQSQLLGAVGGLNNLAATSLNPTANMPAMAQALASIQATGLIQTSDVQAFSGAGVNIWGILAKETGTTEGELRTRFLRAGTPMAMPGNFMHDLMASGAGGLNAFRHTWAGQWDLMKRDASTALAVFETPLGNALAGAAGSIDHWTTQTEMRFKRMSSVLGSDLRTGNLAGFSHALAYTLGDPRLAGTIRTTATALDGLGRIIDHSIIPSGAALLRVAAPGLRALADVIDFMGHHAAVTDTLIATFGGFIVVSRMARWFDDGRRALILFQDTLQSQGPIAALAAWSRGLADIKLAEQNAARATTTETGAMLEQDMVSSESGASMGAMGRLGAAGGLLRGGAIAGGGMLAMNGMTSRFGIGSALQTMGGDAMLGAGIGSIIPGLGTVAGGLIGGIVGAGTDIFRASRMQPGSLGHSTHIDAVNITVPGAGNPQRVANAIPKALNAQIAQYQSMAARRGKQA